MHAHHTIWLCERIYLQKLRQNRLSRVTTECREEGLIETLHREYIGETQSLAELKNILKK